jgi:ribosomal protein L11 methylase PrmA
MIASAFAALCPLQPMRMEQAGLVCAPRSAPELAARALACCPLPVRTLKTVPGWPDPPSAMVAGWYLRSPLHVRAPACIRELVQVTGEGFGPGGHATTAMCLKHLERMPEGPAVDVGCGSGLLTQAWLALDKGAMLACDLDPLAIDQTRRSLLAAGLAAQVTLRHGPAAMLTSADLADRVLIANVPLSTHESLLTRVGDGPRAAVLSGLRPAQAPAVIDAYHALGLQVVSHLERSGFVGVCMMRR